MGRLHEIASVLVSHGLGDLVRRFGVASALERAGKALNWKVGAELARKKPEEPFRSDKRHSLDRGALPVAILAPYGRRL